MIVIADTSPLNYLVLLGHTDLLPRLFGEVLIPPSVFEKLGDPETPEPVRAWIEELPLWLHIQPLRSEPDAGLRYLDRGEQARKLSAHAQAITAAAPLPNHMDADFKFEAFPGTVGGVNGRLQCQGEGQASAVTQRESERTCQSDQVAGDSGVCLIERDDFLNRAGSIFPRFVGSPAAAH